jgi:hypothetical protein
MIGYWRSAEEPAWPDPRDFVDDEWDPNEREIVGEYLDRARPVPWIYCGSSGCRFCGADVGGGEYTDGVYLWPEGLSHYVTVHGVRLPAAVVRHIVEQFSAAIPERIDWNDWKSARRDW